MNNFSQLLRAAVYGNVNAAKTLIELGADVNALAGKDENGVGRSHSDLSHGQF